MGITYLQKRSSCMLTKSLVFRKAHPISPEEIDKAVNVNKACAIMREEYFMRCEKLDEGIYRLLVNTGPEPDEQEIFTREKAEQSYAATAKNYAPVLKASLPFLKSHFTLWDDLAFSFAPETLGNLGNTDVATHIIEMDIASINPDASQFDTFCDTVLHECTHVDQMAKGRLTTTKTSNAWLGKEYEQPTHELRNYESYKKYCSLPWETEARAMSKRLLPDLKAFLKNEGVDIPPDTTWNHDAAIRGEGALNILRKILIGGKGLDG